MIDNFSLAVSHGLIFLAMWRLFFRPDLDDENAPEPEVKPEPESPFAAIRKGRTGA